MAGSFNHLVGDDGMYRGTDLLDDMGDAGEALDECFFIIRSTLNDAQIEEAICSFNRCSRGEHPWPSFMGEDV